MSHTPVLFYQQFDIIKTGSLKEALYKEGESFGGTRDMRPLGTGESTLLVERPLSKKNMPHGFNQERSL